MTKAKVTPLVRFMLLVCRLGFEEAIARTTPQEKRKIVGNLQSKIRKANDNIARSWESARRVSLKDSHNWHTMKAIVGAIEHYTEEVNGCEDLLEEIAENN